MNRWAALALLMAVAGGLALRLPRLDARPLHNDEGVNAVKLAGLWERGDYKYDPHEFHGPTLYYASLPYLWLSPAKNANELDATRLRLVTIAFGVGLIFLLVLLADGLGNTATAIAAVLIAVSPAMVFYSRYFIHEMLLVFFTLLTIASARRYWRTPKARWAVLAGAGGGLMFATKETFVLSIAAMVAAVVATFLWNRWWTKQAAVAGTSGMERTSFRQALHSVRWRQLLNRYNVILAVLVASAVWLVLFTSFFTNWNGLLDSFRTYLPWLHRAGGASPHIHPWHFYFDRLIWWHPSKSSIWTEAFILLLAVFGAVFSFCSNRTIVASPALARFLAFYTVAITAIYSVISYKTPWCLLNFWIGIILLAGIGGAALLCIWKNLIVRAIIGTVLAIGCIHLGSQADLLSREYATLRRHPYTYAQTTPDCLKLVRRVEAIAQVAPTGFDTVVKIIAPDSYGPLPWYLRRFNQTGWWEQAPEDAAAPIVIASTKTDKKLDDALKKTHTATGLFELHPGCFVELYIENDLWKKSLPHLPKEED